MYTLSAIEYFDGTNTTTVIGGIVDVNIDPSLTHIIQSGSGTVDNTHISVGDSAPTVSFNSTDIKTLLDVSGINAVELGGATNSTLKLWLRKRAPGGIYEAGNTNTHVSLMINEGVLVPRTIDNNLGETSTIAYEAIAIYDGTNAPIVIAKNIPFAPTIPVDTDRWTVGPWFYNGTAFAAGSVQRSKIDFGLQLETIKGDGEVYPTQVHVVSRAPSMECDALDVSVFDDALLGITGGMITGITRAFMVKKDFGGMNVLAATAEHISFTMEAGRVHVGNMTGSHQDNASVNVQVTPVDTLDGMGMGKPVWVLKTADAVNAL